MNTTRWRWLILVGGMVFGLGCSAVTSLSATPVPTAAPTLSAAERHLSVFETIWETVRDQYVRTDYDGVDWEVIGQTYRAQVSAGLSEADFADAMRAMLAELPTGQASYQTRAERLEAETSATSTYQGIGAFISFRVAPEPHVVILSVIQDSPAELAGLKAHDSIYLIDGAAISADEATTVVNRIRGPAESSVTLTVETPGEGRREVIVPRGRITAVDFLRGRYDTDLEIAYYRLPVTSTGRDAELIAQDLADIPAEANLRGIILDLRVARNSGAAWPLAELLALFGNGDLGEFYGRDSTDLLTITGQAVGQSQTAPLILLVGPDTEGSPEIFAGALRGARRAVLIGLPTPGAVQGFSEIALPDGSRFFLATSSFRTPDGVDLATSGLQPDVQVNSDWDQVTTDSDPALEAARADGGRIEPRHRSAGAGHPGREIGRIAAPSAPQAIAAVGAQIDVTQFTLRHHLRQRFRIDDVILSRKPAQV
jgi:carboxyl-terminal processing protease